MKVLMSNVAVLGMVNYNQILLENGEQAVFKIGTEATLELQSTGGNGGVVL